MPLYTYKCTACGHEFDELVKYDDRDTKQACKLCGEKSERNVASRFAVSTKLDPKKDTIYTPKEIDKVVGADAEKKWTGYDERWRKKYSDRQKARWRGKEPEIINLPKDADGKTSPIMHLGGKQERSVRKEFSESLKEHRAERKKKGLGQFDGPGLNLK